MILSDLTAGMIESQKSLIGVVVLCFDKGSSNCREVAEM